MAGETPNMHLALIDGGDYISPQPFNQNFQALDQLAVDYIVDQGTSGDWWYRKWKSGLAECGIQNHSCGTLHINSDWGAMQYTRAWNIGSYPFSFVNAPTVSVSANAPSGFWALTIISPTANPNDKGPNIYVIQPTAQTVSGVYMSCYVCGKWQ